MNITEKNRVFECDKCEHKRPSEHGLKMHTCNVHGTWHSDTEITNLKKCLKCETCNNRFQHKKLLNQHKGEKT